MNSTLKPPFKPRNPVAQSPLLKKSGPHRKSKTGIRQASRQSLQHSMEDWRDDLEFEKSLKDEWPCLRAFKLVHPLCHAPSLLIKIS